jgi:hypothetical protein
MIFLSPLKIEEANALPFSTGFAGVLAPVASVDLE